MWTSGIFYGKDRCCGKLGLHSHTEIQGPSERPLLALLIPHHSLPASYIYPLREARTGWP